MRFIRECNPAKRGCEFCADVKKYKFWNERAGTFVKRACCPYDECPYHELDDVKHYGEYDRRVKMEGKNHLEAWLKKVFNVSEK